MAVPTIKNIILDLGNVLVDLDHRRFTEAMGWDHDVFMRFINSEFFYEFEAGQHGEDRFFQELNKTIPLKKGDEQRYRENIHKAFVLRVRTWATVHWLKKRYNVCLFSNTNSIDYNALDKEIEIKRVIRNSYVSFAEKVIKPDPRAYQRIMEMFRLEPGVTLFVDDRQENIDGALKAGWHAERVENEAGLFDIFSQYHIL